MEDTLSFYLFGVYKFSGVNLLGNFTLVFSRCENCGEDRWINIRQYRSLCFKCSMLLRKGLKRHPDICKKISESKKGYKHTQETCQKISDNHHDVSGFNNPMYNKEHTKRTKMKMKKPHPSMIGSNNPAWNGGISFEDYPKEFQKIKLYIRLKYNNCDYISGIHKNICSPNEELSVHHTDYNKKNNEEDNLIPLCRKNHIKTNTNRQFWYRLFKYSLEYDKEFKNN